MWAYKNKEIERIVLSGLEKIDLGLGPGWGGGGGGETCGDARCLV